MPLILVRTGVTFGIGNGKVGAWAPYGTGPGPSGGGTTPVSVPVIQGYWDASGTANLLGPSGAGVAGWNLSVSSIADTSGNNRPLAFFSQSSSPVPPVGTARLNGLLGGVGRNTVVPPGSLPLSGQYLPVMDPDSGFQLPAATFGTDLDWPIYLVWSRPNWRQGASTTAVPLLMIGGVPVVTLGSTASATALTLFATGAATVLNGSMSRRHSHWLLLS